MAHPATKKRGGDPDVKHKPAHEKPDDAMERKLEEGLEESMAGSDPVSITQPPPARSTSSNEKKKNAPIERSNAVSHKSRPLGRFLRCCPPGGNDLIRLRMGVRLTDPFTHNS